MRIGGYKLDGDIETLTVERRHRYVPWRWQREIYRLLPGKECVHLTAPTDDHQQLLFELKIIKRRELCRHGVWVHAESGERPGCTLEQTLDNVAAVERVRVQQVVPSGYRESALKRVK